MDSDINQIKEYIGNRRLPDETLMIIPRGFKRWVLVDEYGSGRSYLLFRTPAMGIQLIGIEAT